MSVYSVTKLIYQRRRALIILPILLIIYSSYCLIRFTSPISLSTVNPLPRFRSSTSADFLPIHEAESLCSSYNLTIYPDRKSRRKIYDLILVNSELDMLEIRMHELQHLVDYFVILESPTTFTRNPKPLNFKSNFHLFQDFYPKIIYHILNLDHIKPPDDLQ